MGVSGDVGEVGYDKVGGLVDGHAADVWRVVGCRYVFDVGVEELR